MVAKLESMLLKNVGKRVVVVDGVTTEFTELKKDLAEWKSEVVRESAAVTVKPRAAVIDLS
jgi:hypothetical protein